jgi:hypothetical protein
MPCPSSNALHPAVKAFSQNASVESSTAKRKSGIATPQATRFIIQGLFRTAYFRDLNSRLAAIEALSKVVPAPSQPVFAESRDFHVNRDEPEV